MSLSSPSENNSNVVPKDLSRTALALIAVPPVLTSFLVFLDASIIVSALPTIISDFGSITDIGWFSSIYLLCNCSLQPLLGKLYTCLNLKWTFIAFLALFELGSLVCALATSSGMLIAGRALAGFGGAGVLNGSLTIISAAVAPDIRPTFLSIALGVGQLGTAFGPTIGGALTEYSTWRWSFYMNLPIGGFALLLLLLAPIPRYAEGYATSTKTKIRTILELDWRGFAVFAASVTMVLLALQWATDETKPWNSATIIGLFVGAGIGAIVFGVWEWYLGDDALIPFRIIRRAVVWSGCLTCFFQMANMVISMYFLPLWFQLVKGVSPALSGVYILPMVGVQILTVVVTGILVRHVGRYSAFCVVNGVLVAAGAAMSTLFSRTTSAGYWVGAELLIGVGRGCGIQMPFLAIQDKLNPSDAAVGNSLAIFSQYFGGAIFAGIAEAVLVVSMTGPLKAVFPNVDPHSIITASGLGSLASIPASMRSAVIGIYNHAITNVFILVAATAGALVLAGLGMGWRAPPAAPAIEVDADCDSRDYVQAQHTEKL